MREVTHSNPEEPRETGEQELCTQCLTGNQPGSHFCRHCGAPLSSYAATGPFESLFAEGHVYRRAAEQPQRWVVVLGMWVIFGSLAVAGVTLAAMSWHEANRLGVLAGIGLVGISTALVVKTTKRYGDRRGRKREAPP